MMLNKHAIGTIALLCSTPLFANIPIESRELSQNTATNLAANQTAINTGDTSSVPTNLNWQMMQKIQQLENDLRTLRGKLEEQDNTIDQLKSELNNRYADLDQRLELLQQKIDPPETTNAPEEDNQQGSAPSPNPKSTAATKTINAPVTTATTQSTNEEQEKAAYTVALDAYKQGGAKKAIAPMQNFIKNNPNSIYISNAYFWLAEFNLAIEPTNYAEAKKNYSIVVTKYPNSSRASRSLYQLYSIAKDVDHNSAQAMQYKNKLLSSYPQSEEVKYFKK